MKIEKFGCDYTFSLFLNKFYPIFNYLIYFLCKLDYPVYIFITLNIVSATFKTVWSKCGETKMSQKEQCPNLKNISWFQFLIKKLC